VVADLVERGWVVVDEYWEDEGQRERLTGEALWIALHDPA
jgi:hypothetical protein